MKKNIIIILILLGTFDLYSFNRTIPLYLGTESVGRSSLNIPEGEAVDSFYFNPAIAGDVKILEASYIISKSRFTAIDYRYYKNNFGFQLGINYYQSFKNFQAYDTTLYTIVESVNIGGINLGGNFNYYSLSINDNSGKGWDFSAGIKKSGMIAQKRIDVGLAYRRETKLEWENEYDIIEKLPSQVLAGANLITEDFDFSAGLHYVFPVFINDNANFSKLIYDDELRLSFSTGINVKLRLKFKINLGYQQVFDNKYDDLSKKFIGIGANLPLNRIRIKIAYNSNSILEKTDERIELLCAGAMLKFH